MPPVSGTLTTHKVGAAGGNREDLEDVVYQISPEETPFMSQLTRTKIRATLHEWMQDALTTAATNAVAEGIDATFSTAVPRVRVKNYAQISQKTVLVSGTQDVVDKAGVDSEFEYQSAQRAAELKRDMEVVLTQNQGSTAGAWNSARKLGSLEAWIETNNYSASSGAVGGYTTTGKVIAATDASALKQRTFTEALLKTALKDCWTAGGNPKDVMVGAFNKQKASAFAGIATQYRDNPQKGAATIIAAADVYVSDFGTVRIWPNRFNRDRTAMVLDMTKWAIGYLRPFKFEPLAKTGDAKKGQWLVEYTLIAKHEGASARIADLKTS